MMIPTLDILRICAIIIALVALPFSGLSNTANAQENRPLIIFAAASLKDVLDHFNTEIWVNAQNNSPARISYGASATMARQVASGAPADIYLSAHHSWIDFIASKGLVAGDRNPVATNRLVLATYDPSITMDQLFSENSSPKIAIADPALSPAGMYSMQYLESSGNLPRIKGRLLMAQNVRAVLRLIEYGGVSGFIYKSDAVASNNAHILSTIPSSNHQPIIYSGILINNHQPDASLFLKMLTDTENKHIWTQFGFSE